MELHITEYSSQINTAHGAMLRSGANWQTRTSAAEARRDCTRATAYRYALRALTDGHDERRILSCYSDALFVCHGFAVDQAGRTGKIAFFNLSSTVGKARQRLAKDGLTRAERMARWYRSHPRDWSREVPFEITPEDLALARRQIAASLGVGVPPESLI